MKKITYVSLIMLIVLTSCNDVSNFLFETDQNVELRSVSNGALYKGGESIPLTISYDREITPDEFTVSIFDDEGKSWGDTTVIIPEVEDEYNTSLVIPDQLPQGKYIFHIRVYESGQEITFKEIIIFKTDTDYIIDKLYSLPHETEAGKDVLIQADILSPEGVDPYLRWRLENTVINEGFLSDGLDTIHWLAEDEYGLYLISLEVFPEYCDDSYSSSVSASTKIVVTDMSQLEVDSLTPDEDYSLLFHFSGDLEPSDESKFSVTKKGNLNFESKDSNFGYLFSEHNGLEAEGFILPSESGYITPFSINGRASLIENYSEGNLINFMDGSKSILSVTVDDSGHLICTINGNQSRSLFALHQLTDFTISLIPGKDNVHVHWYYNGAFGGKDTLDTDFIPVSEVQKVVIGGNDDQLGAGIFLDELGIFVGQDVESTIDADQFRRFHTYLFGDNLVAAEGYDGIDDLEYIQDGNLIIQPGENILLSSFSKSINETEIVLSLSDSLNNEGDSWNAYLADESGSKLLVLSESDLIRETDIYTGNMTEKIRFSLFTDEGVVKVKIEGNDRPVAGIEGLKSGDIISLYFETNVENNNKAYLDYFIIFTNVETLDKDMTAASEKDEKLL